MIAITTFLGKDVIFNGLKHLSSGIHTMVHYILTHHDHHNVSERLEALDLVSKVMTIEAMVEEMQDNVKEKRSHNLALNYVHETIGSIHKELKQLDEEMKTHETRWFSSWREPNADASLLRLHHLKGQLERRVRLFIQIMQLPSGSGSRALEIEI